MFSTQPALQTCKAAVLKARAYEKAQEPIVWLLSVMLPFLLTPPALKQSAALRNNVTTPIFSVFCVSYQSSQTHCFNPHQFLGTF
jgi:hypothetical protein